MDMEKILTYVENIAEKEQSKQVQTLVPERKIIPGCCFEREFQGW